MAASSGQDVTSGSLKHNIWRLAWPIIITQMIFMLPNLYDTFWIGTLGSDAQAASGLAMSVRVTMISVLMALSGGCGAVVARYVGAKDQEQADLATMQAVILMIVSSGVLGLIGFILAEPLMKLAGAEADVLPLAIQYARVLFAGLIAMEMVPSVGYMLSAAGAPGVLLEMSLWSMVTLLISEPLLVKSMGITGASLALVAANTAGMLWGLGVLIKGRAPVHLKLRELRLDWLMIKRILNITGPGVIQRGAPNLAMSVLMRLVSFYGAATTAAWVVVQRVFNTALIPAMGLTRTAPAMVGQNLGAQQPTRAGRAIDLLARITALVAVVTMVIVVLFAPQMMRLFSDDITSVAAGTQMLRLLSIGYLAYVMNLVWDAAQVGAGDTASPMLINIITLWLVQVPLAYLLSRATSLDANGIWIALIIGWVVQAILMYARYRQGHWKTKKV